MVIFYSSARFSTTLTHPTKIPRSLSPRCQEQPPAAMPHRGSCLCVFCCYREVTLGISSNTTTPSPAARPPPEPPPPHSTSLFIFTVASPPADLTTPRPDPKPPWLLSHGSTSPSILLCSKVCVFKSDGVVFLLFYALCFYVYSVVVVSCYVFLFLIVVWIKFAFKVFVERFLLCWLFWKGFFHPDSNSAETWMTTCNIFYSFYRQASIVIMGKMKNSSNRASGAKFVMRKVATVNDTSSISSNKHNETQKHSSDEGVKNGCGRRNLYEICAANYWKPPVFECSKEEGPCHQRMFTFRVSVEIDEGSKNIIECYGAPHLNKKTAADHAADGALWYLKQKGFVMKSK